MTEAKPWWTKSKFWEAKGAVTSFCILQSNRELCNCKNKTKDCPKIYSVEGSSAYEMGGNMEGIPKKTKQIYIRDTFLESDNSL